MAISIIINNNRGFDYYEAKIDSLSDFAVEIIIDDYNNDLESSQAIALFQSALKIHSLTDILTRQGPKFDCIILGRPCWYRGRPRSRQIVGGLRIRCALFKRQDFGRKSSRPSWLLLSVELLCFVYRILSIRLRGDSRFKGIDSDRKIRFPKGLDIGPKFPGGPAQKLSATP